MNMNRVRNRAGRAGLGQANSGLGQQWAGPKPSRAKIGLVFSGQNFSSLARPKTGLVRLNSLLKAKKIRAGRAGPNLARFFSGQ